MNQVEVNKLNTTYPVHRLIIYHDQDEVHKAHKTHRTHRTHKSDKCA